MTPIGKFFILFASALCAVFWVACQTPSHSAERVASEPALHVSASTGLGQSKHSAAGPNLVVDLDAERHPISPDIYGINFGPDALVAELNMPIRRWGGNAATRYNWRLDVANRASDWFFENIPEENEHPEQLPDGSVIDDFVAFNQQAGTKSVLTMPLIGWTPKSREISCGFSVAKYGAQQQVDPWQADCGNGIRTDGSAITGNDPADTSLAIEPSFVSDWVAHLVSRFGTAAQGGVTHYSLDNEPMLWQYTHRDVHPDPVGADELRDRTYAYASAIKEADPSAQTAGPVVWGWSAYFNTALEQSNESVISRKVLGGADDAPFVGRYLQDMKTYEDANGVRILDYLDLHFYPQAPGVALSSAGDSATQALRLRSTRALWDPTYVDESWIGQPVYLIPRMREWVQTYYPGTKLSISEYNWGGLEHINGALAQADILGIFGREQLDMAMLWAALDADQPYAYAFRLYLDYDGLGSQFGEVSVHAESSDLDRVSIYAAQRMSDGAATIMVINKSGTAITSELLVNDEGLFGTASSYVYSAAHLDAIILGAEYPWNGDGYSLTLPPESITLLVAPHEAVIVEPTSWTYLPYVGS